MTEDQWWRCNDWQPMLEFVVGRITPRKAQLFLCAGSREIWHLFYDASQTDAVEIGERMADGIATEEELWEPPVQAEGTTFGFDFDLGFIRRHMNDGNYSPGVRRLIEMGVYSEEDIRIGKCDDHGHLGDPQITNRLKNASYIAYRCICYVASEARITTRTMDRLSQEPEWPGGWLMREMFGNPFHPITIKPEWLKWSGGTVPALAQMIYDERAYDRMPILADALQDAGCDSLAMITHCRKGGRHVRGCWVIDALLGKLRFNPPHPYN